MDPRLSFLGQFASRLVLPRTPAPGRLRIPPRTALRDVRLPPPTPQYSLQVYELPTVGFSAWPLPWRRTAALSYDNLRDAERALALVCQDVEDCNALVADRQRGDSPFPTTQCRNRGPVAAPRVKGNRTIVRIFESTDSFQTSRVMQECDVPSWHSF